MTSMNLSSEHVCCQQIGILHLPLRVYNVLTELGIATVDDLIRASAEELESHIGQKNLIKVHECISSLYEAHGDNLKSVNWDKFFDLQGIMVIPSTWQSESGAQSVLSKLPVVVKDVLEADSGERAWVIIRHRFGLQGSSLRTLEELGLAFGLTRERVRQLELKRLKLLKKCFLEGNFSGKSYQIHHNFLKNFKKTSKLIEKKISTGIRESEFKKYLVEDEQIDSKTPNSVFEITFAIIGVKRLETSIPGTESILYSEASPLHSNTEYILKTIHDFLTSQSEAMNDIDILIEVNKGLKKKERLQVSQLRTILPLCGSIEVVEKNLFRSKFEFLNSRLEQMERILEESGTQMLAADICRELNRRRHIAGRRALEERYLANQMSADDRFQSIGRSGYWTLTKWEVMTDSILDVMKQFFLEKDATAHTKEITSYVQSKRPASASSISSYLAFNSAFTKFGPDSWGLSSWKESYNVDSWSLDNVGNFVENFFRNKKIKEVEYKILKKALVDASGFSNRQAQGLLNSNPVIETKVVKHDYRVAVFQPDYRQKLKNKEHSPKRTKATVTEKIEQDVREILSAQPGKKMGLNELVNELVERHGHRYKQPKPTLYTYVSKIDFVKKTSIGEGKSSQVCSLIDNTSEELHAKVASIQTEVLRTRALRALNFLNENDVDIALFLLGKEFEEILKKYIIAAVQSGMLPAPNTRKRLALSDMISVIKNNRIITDDAVLSFLRQQRNDRAHGAMPSIEERRVMLSHISVTAGMYIDYIKFFDDLTENVSK